MVDISDYVILDCIEEYEFGFALSTDNTGFVILVLVFHHQSFSVDVAGIAITLEEAFEIYFDALQNLQIPVSL